MGVLIRRVFLVITAGQDIPIVHPNLCIGLYYSNLCLFGCHINHSCRLLSCRIPIFLHKRNRGHKYLTYIIDLQGLFAVNTI